VAALSVWAAASTVLTLTTVPLKTPRVGLFAGGEDLWVYREAARNVTANLDIYKLPVLGEHFYTYTPFSTIAFLPFGLLPGGSDKYIWMAVNLLVLAAVVGCCWRILGYRITPAIVGGSALLTISLVFLEPVRTTLFFGQINLVLLLLVLWDNSCRQRSRLKGVGIGLAAGFRPSGELGGEPSFRGQTNGIWLWQNGVGAIVVSGLLDGATHPSSGSVTRR